MDFTYPDVQSPASQELLVNHMAATVPMAAPMSAPFTLQHRRVGARPKRGPCPPLASLDDNRTGVGSMTDEEESGMT
jgi:hypothetical protein